MRRRRRLINLSMISLVAIALPVRGGEREATNLRNGEAAIRSLGGRVDDVARANGLSRDQFTSMLRNDPTMHVDATGAVLAIDPQHTGEAHGDVAAEAITTSAAVPIPYADTFRLHSRPGAQRVIYLDFDGHQVVGTAWNANYTGGAAYYADPYDIDGVPSTFSNAEQDVVQRVWQRVSEDYAPFDVDVTTEEPAAGAITRTNSTDQTYGTRLVVSNTTSVYSRCNCGGIAYVGVYDQATNHDYYQPAFVFTRGVGSGDKNIAEAASHEVGHNFGLSHDGTSTTGYFAGQGAWAPIMGVGYYRPLTQWSRGEYTNANNTQDDLAVIQTHGGTLRADDHGDSFAAATALTGPTLSAAGRISTGGDKDVFSFVAGAGGATLRVDPAPYGPDVDLRLELFDENGNPLANADPPSGITSADIAYGLDASVTLTLTPGTYFVRVSSVGNGSPLSTGYSNYGSIGQYTFTGTIGQADTLNTAPVAVAAATPTGVVPGQTVAFSSAGSLDPDGTIASYRWTFGDGTSSTMANPSKAYAATGSFTATLTVTDSLGATGTASVTITVLPASVRVQTIRMSMVTRGGRTTGTAMVMITDSIGRPVRGATVQANWTGTTTSPASGTTGAQGTVVIKSPATASRSPSFTVTIANVTVPGKPYDPRLNLVTNATLRR